jgi:hypothetical protein
MGGPARGDDLRRAATHSCLGRFPGWALAGLALAIGAIGSFPSALCLGADGHVAIEVTQAGRCVAGGPTAEAPAGIPSPSVLTLPAPAGHCGPCRDLTASSGEWICGTKLVPLETGPILAAVAALPAAALHGPSQHPASSPHERLPAARVLRGTVLRC